MFAVCLSIFDKKNGEDFHGIFHPFFLLLQFIENRNLLLSFSSFCSRRTYSLFIVYLLEKYSLEFLHENSEDFSYLLEISRIFCKKKRRKEKKRKEKKFFFLFCWKWVGLEWVWVIFRSSNFFCFLLEYSFLFLFLLLL